MSTAPPEPGAPTGYRLPPASRIRRGRDIQHLLRRGKRTRTPSLDVFVIASPVSRPRFGLVVPKHRHEVVERNRVRRRLRELGRTVVLPALWKVAPPLDLLVRARREAYGRTYSDLKEEIEGSLKEICSPSCS